MSTKRARDTFKEMINLCYEEDFPELHRELISLVSVTKKNKEPYKYESAMQEVLTIIPLFTDDFPDEVFAEIEKLYQEYLEENE
jgi:phosphoglycerate-specific signal transduction histidine kinase